MQASTPDRSGTPPDPPPHVDASRWEELIESLGPSAMLVVIDSSMSKALKEQCSPEDIWQETLAHAWRDRAQHVWQGPAAYRGWLFEIARNRIREAARSLRSGKRGAGRPAVRFSELAPGSSGSVSGLLPHDSTTPSRVLARGEKQAAVRKALSELPPDLEPIVRMHLFEELTMEVIAERQGIGLSAAWHRFRKGWEIYARILERRMGGGSSVPP